MCGSCVSDLAKDMVRVAQLLISGTLISAVNSSNLSILSNCNTWRGGLHGSMLIPAKILVDPLNEAKIE